MYFASLFLLMFNVNVVDHWAFLMFFPFFLLVQPIDSLAAFIFLIQNTSWSIKAKNWKVIGFS